MQKAQKAQGKAPPATRGGKRGSSQQTLRDDRVTIQWLRDLMREFLRQREWEKYHLPRNLAASISVEAGELLELFQWLTPEEAAARCANDAAFRQAVGEELCDVLIFLPLDLQPIGHEKTRCTRTGLETGQLAPQSRHEIHRADTLAFLPDLFIT